MFENVYFGLYFGSTLGLLPSTLATLMGQPVLLIIPKLLNVVAGAVVLALLLWRWLPLAVRKRGLAEQRATDLETLATIDFLTGLNNRGHFEVIARAELARCQRYVRPLSILMLDIDNFKAVNDRYGHDVGDRVLKAVAEICRAAKRDSDVASRIGGEEFAILLTETNEAAATEFAERLRVLVRDCPLRAAGEKISVTVSIGIASANLRTSGVESLMQGADHAMYDAKRQRRNKVVLARPIHSKEMRVAAE